MVYATRADGTYKKIVNVKTNWTQKIRVSVCLTVKANDTKLSPLIVFKGAKREIAALDKKVKNCCIESSPNTLMNTDLTHT